MSKTPDKDLQTLANDFLADFEAELLADPSCALACRLQDVRDAAHARAKAFSVGSCCPSCGWPESGPGGRCQCKGKVKSHRLPLTQVACRDTEGRIWSMPRPFRHHHVLRIMHDHGAKQAEDNHGNQGFLDESGRYLTRKQALVNAKANDQIKNGEIIGGVLTSEDLW